MKMAIDWLTEWLPSLEIGQALTLLVIIDFLIFFAVAVRWARKSKPSKASTPTPPSEKAGTPYFEVEENREESKDGELREVAEALKGLHKDLPVYPMPSLDGAPPHLQALVSRSKNPNLFTIHDVTTGIPLAPSEAIHKVDKTTLPMGPKVEEKKNAKRDGFVV